jgi:formamidopyrimidine-DNA glycosylase
MMGLAEVEVVRGVMSRDMVGKKIKTLTLTTGGVCSRHKSSKEFRALAEGRSIKSVQRLGLKLILTLDNGSALIIALSPTTTCSRAASAKVAKPKHTKFVITPTAGSEWRITDADDSLQVWVAEPIAVGTTVELSRLASFIVGGDGLTVRRSFPSLAGEPIDISVDQVGSDLFAATMKATSAPVAAALRDPRLYGGLGTVAIDETLYAAALRPTRAANQLSSIELRRLHRTLTEIVAESIKQGGTSLEGGFSDPDGKLGNFQSQLQVVGRVGEPCGQCRATLVSEVVEAVAHTYCPKCQA